MIRFSVLASSSAGNASVISAGGVHVLVDAGISALQLKRRLAEVGLELEDLSAVLVTHEHADHTQGLHQLSKRVPVRVFCTRHTGMEIREKAPHAACSFFEAGHSFELGDLRVTPFGVAHDAVDPVGFRFDCGEVSLGYLTDTGHVQKHVPEFLAGVEALYLESNYEPDILAACTRRPWPLKQRIASQHGHLSNGQACEFVEAIAHQGLRHLVLAHLSRECNEPGVARALMMQALTKLGLSTNLYCASPVDVLPWITVEP